MTPVDLELFVTRGLGDSSYLLASGREAVLVDPQRDAWRFIAAAESKGWRIVRVLETHVHNDYLSGALETRAATGAEITAPARGRYEFEHTAADDGDRFELGEYVLTAMATPGHTPEHLAWLVADARAEPPAPGGTVDPLAVFSGGSLLSGSVGRTDLLGPVLEPAMTLDQQRTLQRLATLPDGVRILPTHGAGSFCSAGPVASTRTTTVGDERVRNPAFAGIDLDADAFRDRLLGGLGLVPAYYGHMAAANRAGPRVLGGYRRPPALDPTGVARASEAAGGATIVDARHRDAFAAGHIEGSLNIELNDTFAAYVGWLVPFAAPLVLVLPEPVDEALEEATTQLLRVGYERVLGFVDGGVEAWRAAGHELSSYPITTMEAVNAGTERVLLDVRQPNEWRDDGSIPGAHRIFVADLPNRLAEIPSDQPITVLCKSGARAAIAASVLDAAGRDVRLVARGGATQWTGEFDAPR
jgi:glyoxylase-like metal-dependent hydrolase (beta-lactamase superfamily II)/rhodanese-related sulfurtransferase